MKKMILLAVITVGVFSFAACSGGHTDGDNVLETANTVYNVSGNGASVALDENTAKTLLGAFSSETLGLVNAIDEYELKLSPTKISGTDACAVEAYDGDSEAPEGRYAICGTDCYIYDSSKQRYLKLTTKGAVEISETDSVADSVSETENVNSDFIYDKDNNSVLQKKFAVYDRKTLGIEKDLSSYVLVTSGTAATAADGKTVCVVRLYEKNGEFTGVSFAFNESADYIFSEKDGNYQKLKK